MKFTLKANKIHAFNFTLYILNHGIIANGVLIVFFFLKLNIVKGHFLNKKMSSKA